jgi:ubiquinone/menaquinone biosynthesis C-methylase UbiE
MNIVDYRVSPKLYAKLYSKLEITGTQFLAFRDIADLVHKYVNGAATLDYGCGAGKSTLYLKSLGLNVKGVDINKEMVSLAQLADPRGAYQVISSGKIASIDSSYDLVFSSWVMLEVSSKQELLKITQEIQRVLKNDGIFIMVVCNKDTYNMDWLSENTEFPENKNLCSGSKVKMLFKDINLSIYDYYWTEEDYREVIETAGMGILQSYNPLGKDTDGYNWLNEKIKSPLTIYVAKKQCSVVIA